MKDILEAADASVKQLRADVEQVVHVLDALKAQLMNRSSADDALAEKESEIDRLKARVSDLRGKVAFYEATAADKDMGWEAEVVGE